MIDVLVIDFDPEVREQAGIALNGGVFDLTFASDGVEAIKLLRVKNFDLILVDTLMPGAVSSLDVIQGLRSVAPKSTLIAICEVRGQHVAESALRAGAGGILFKPVTSKQILEAAKKLLGPTSFSLDQGTIPPLTEKVELPGIPLLVNFSDVEKEQFLQLAEKMSLDAQEKYQFDGQNGIAILISGMVKGWYGAHYLGLLSPGQAIGESNFFIKSEHKVTITVIAAKPSEFYFLRKPVLKEFFRSTNKNLMLRFSVNVIASLSQKLLNCYDETFPQNTDTVRSQSLTTQE